MRSVWLNNGGHKTIKSIEDKNLSVKDLKWLAEYIANMPHIISSKSYIFVHAFYNPNLS